MNIALISHGKTLQDQDLLAAAKQKGHHLDFIHYPFAQKFDPQKEFEKIKKYDLIYWRIGNLRLRKELAKICLKAKIPFINSIYAYFPQIAPKSLQIQKISQASLKTPKTLLVNQFDQDEFNKLKNSLALPFIIKPDIGRQGQDVFLIKKLLDFPDLPHSSDFIAQEFLPNTGDYRVITVSFKAIGLYKRIPAPGEIRANIAQGGSGERVTDKEIIKKLSRLAEKAARVLKLEIAGFDFIQSNNQLYFIEANTIVQWQGFKKTTGINVAEKIIDYFQFLQPKILH